MNWNYDPLRACHELLAEDQSVAARIYESDKPKMTLPFRAKSLISVFYYGEQRLNSLARRNKEWVSNRRKFKTKAAREIYVAARKKEILHFLLQRVAQGA